jgi:hypothetical protein
LYCGAAQQVAWNPREAFNFTLASEDNNLYSFDMRKLDIATNIHKDFVSVRWRCAHTAAPPCFYMTLHAPFIQR